MRPSRSMTRPQARGPADRICGSRGAGLRPACLTDTSMSRAASCSRLAARSVSTRILPSDRQMDRARRSAHAASWLGVGRGGRAMVRDRRRREGWGADLHLADRSGGGVPQRARVTRPLLATGTASAPRDIRILATSPCIGPRRAPAAIAAAMGRGRMLRARQRPRDRRRAAIPPRTSSRLARSPARSRSSLRLSAGFSHLPLMKKACGALIDSSV